MKLGQFIRCRRNNIKNGQRKPMARPTVHNSTDRLRYREAEKREQAQELAEKISEVGK